MLQKSIIDSWGFNFTSFLHRLLDLCLRKDGFCGERKPSFTTRRVQARSERGPRRVNFLWGLVPRQSHWIGFPQVKISEINENFRHFI